MKARLPEGYGPQSRGDLMKQYQALQENMQIVQQQLKETEYTATSGGGMATAVVNGDHRVVSVSVKPEIVDPDDSEMMCDMIAAAVNEAMHIADEDAAARMGELTGGLGALGGMLG